MKFRKKQSRRTQDPAIKGRSMAVNNYYRPKGSKPSAAVDTKEPKTGRLPKLSSMKIVNAAILLLIFAVIVFATTLSPTPVIVLGKDNAQYYQVSTYQQAAAETMKDSVLNRSKFLFQSTSFEEEMKNKFPEISQISAVVPLGDRDLTVLIKVSDPFASVLSGGEKGIINEDGVLVSKGLESSTEGLLFVRFTTPQQNFVVGSRVLTGDEVDLLKLIELELADTKFSDGTTAEVSEVIFNVADGQLEVRLKEKPYFVKVSTFTDGAQQVGSAKATLLQLDREGTQPAQYMDVRVPGRVFVL